MQQPQSPSEIQYYIDELKRLDPLFDIVWDPKAVQVAAGSYSATGKRIDGEYDGRWRVIRYDDPEAGHAGFHPERGYVHMCYVCEYTRVNGVLAIVVGGAYAPVDDRLLELFRSSNAANADTAREIRRRLDAHDAKLDRDDIALDEGMAREGLDRVHFKANYAGGVGNWQGKGADFAAMADAARTKRAVSNILGTARQERTIITGS